MEGLSGTFFSICILGIFLLLGKLIRVKVKLFQNIFLPSSIIGGFLALSMGPYLLNLIPAWVFSTWTQIPGLLISVVFATLFLGVKIPGIKRMWTLGGSQFCFGMVAGMGQYFIGLIVTALILIPLFDVPPIFSSILEIGFAGGHGTAAGMTEVFTQLNFPAGAPLGQMSATVGIIVAVVGGIFYINIAIRRGYCANLDMKQGIPVYKKTGLIPEEKRTPTGTATVAAESIEPFAFHFTIVALSILIGWFILSVIRKLHPILSGFPLFPLAMIGGMIVQAFSARISADKYYDRNTFESILGFSLDVLVVAAIASIRLDLFLENVFPFSILMISGIIWLFFALAYLAPRMFPYNWLERGITEFGMQSGVTAMGLLLLRLVDPHYKTDTAQAFGFKQMLYEPFLGGGFITATAPFLIIGLGLWWSILISGIIMLVFLLISKLNGWFRYLNREKGPFCPCSITVSFLSGLLVFLLFLIAVITDLTFFSMLKKLILFLLLPALSVSLSGQSVGLLKEGGIYFELIKDFENTQMSIGNIVSRSSLRYEEIQGTPYLQGDFQKGELITHDSIRYVNVSLRYNIFTDEMEYQTGNEVRSISNPMNFRYYIIGEDVFVYYPFQAGSNSIKRGFFQLLYIGKAIFMKRFSVTYEPAEAPQPYADVRQPRFIRRSDAYFIRFPDRMPEEISLNKRRIMEVFPEHRQELDKFVNENRLRLRNEEEVIRLLIFYHQL